MNLVGWLGIIFVAVGAVADNGIISEIETALSGAGGYAPELTAELDALRSGKVDAADQRWGNLRKQAVQSWLGRYGVKEIIFATRQVDGDGHWYANFSYWSNKPERNMYHNGGRLCRMNLETGEIVNLIDDPEGGVRDPQVHYNAQKILFSWRKGGQPFFHLYEINIDGTGLRQITSGDYDDLEAAYLPDGGIVFCSSRCNRMVNCWFVRVAVIHRCDADGSNIRALSTNIEQDNTPWVLPDGRILYQRWEYIDRSQVQFHHLWTMNQDGTGQMVYYGNMHPDTVMLDAKPIPGTRKVLASFSPGHGRKEHAGFVTVVDSGQGPDVKESARRISKDPIWRDPFPLSEDCFMVAGDKTDIRVMNDRGESLELYNLPKVDRDRGLWVHEPRPLIARERERISFAQVDLASATGRVYLQDVNIGRKMEGVKRGEIKKLLVMEVLPKPVNFSGGMEPLTLGGSFTLERILGTVPVEEDGSAYFELPAMRSLFFVALDENEMSVKRMQSFMSVQPGEVVSCIGCHENRAGAPPPARAGLAGQRAPSLLQPIADVPDVFDFPRDIQPILDRHCVACHSYEKSERGGPISGGVILVGDRGPWYSHSYAMLTYRNQFADGRNAQGNRAPRTIGSSASPILKKLAGEHHGVKATDHERKMVRLWIESAAVYPGSYAALGSGMTGDIGQDKRIKEIFEKRCISCHDKKESFSFHTVYNLSRPEKSLVLLKPLSQSAGGYAMKRWVTRGDKKVEEMVAVFNDTNDPDYQSLLKKIAGDKAHLENIRRFDMEGFKPNEHYIREMKVYGLLPASFDPAKETLDPYQMDELYWRSHWYTPPEG